MSRRIALPGADELFRSTGEPTRVDEFDEGQAPDPVTLPVVRALPDAVPAFPSAPDTDDGLEEASSAVRTAPRRRARSVADRRPSGRERHEEKITVYVSNEELMDLEH